jgi:hypothetical protein
MVSFKSFVVAYGLALLTTLVTAAPVVPRLFERKLFTRDNITASTVSVELGAQLSKGSLIFGSDSPEWFNATVRWNQFVRPNVQVVVQPAAESDIAKIVRIHSENS